jgi:hypothetical protein
MKPFLLFLFLATSCLAFAAGGVSVSGLVTDSVSGVPIDAAQVGAVGDEARESVATDVNGIFTLPLREGIEPGSVIEVHVQKRGYNTYVLKIGVAPSLPHLIRLVPINPTRIKKTGQSGVRVTPSEVIFDSHWINETHIFTVRNDRNTDAYDVTLIFPELCT